MYVNSITEEKNIYENINLRWEIFEYSYKRKSTEIHKEIESINNKLDGDFYKNNYGCEAIILMLKNV